MSNPKLAILGEIQLTPDNVREILVQYLGEAGFSIEEINFKLAERKYGQLGESETIFDGAVVKTKKP